MRVFIKIALAVSVLWSISACTHALNEVGVSMDQSRKSAIGR
jgi:hypothetical protein